jgi:putative transposase
VAQRNGFRPRAWDTRVGELELRILRLRTGSYFPSFLEPHRRVEQALVAVVQEAYVNGVGTVGCGTRRFRSPTGPPQRPS